MRERSEPLDAQFGVLGDEARRIVNVRGVDVGIGRSLESSNPREISDPNVATCNFFANEATEGCWSGYTVRVTAR